MNAEAIGFLRYLVNDRRVQDDWESEIRFYWPLASVRPPVSCPDFAPLITAGSNNGAFLDACIIHGSTNCAMDD